jgi:hypothetical protein
MQEFVAPYIPTIWALGISRIAFAASLIALFGMLGAGVFACYTGRQ